MFGSQYPDGALTVNTPLPFINGDRPAWQVGAAFAFVTSFVIEGLNNSLLAIERSKSLLAAPSFMIHTVGAAMSWYALPRLLADGSPPSSSLMLAGAASELISAYLYQGILSPSSGFLGESLMTHKRGKLGR